MKELTIGACRLGKSPKVAAVVDKPIPLRTIQSMVRHGADILEIRADLFPGDFSNVLGYIEKLRASCTVPCIGTLRETKKNVRNRTDLFRALIPFVDAIDIEIDTPIARQVIAQAEGKTVIVSEHDFEGTPDNRRLAAIVTRAMRLGADIVKIAAMARSYHDTGRLMSFAVARQEPLVVISMGKYGAASRIVAPVFGSLYTYAFTGKSVAPGQFSLETTRRLLKTFFA